MCPMFGNDMLWQGYCAECDAQAAHQPNYFECALEPRIFNNQKNFQTPVKSPAAAIVKHHLDIASPLPKGTSPPSDPSTDQAIYFQTP